MKEIICTILFGVTLLSAVIFGFYFAIQDGRIWANEYASAYCEQLYNSNEHKIRKRDNQILCKVNGKWVIGVL